MNVVNGGGELSNPVEKQTTKKPPWQSVRDFETTELGYVCIVNVDILINRCSELTKIKQELNQSCPEMD